MSDAYVMLFDASIMQNILIFCLINGLCLIIVRILVHMSIFRDKWGDIMSKLYMYLSERI